MKKFIKIIGIAGIICFFSINQAFAKDIQKVEYTKQEGQNTGLKFPRKAKSWGGTLHSGPGTKFEKLETIKQGEWVVLIEPTDIKSNNFRWFKIEYRGHTGFQWGGFICSVGEQVPGTFNRCKAN